MELSAELRKKLLVYQRNEITEHHMYAQLAGRIRLPENQRVLENLANDELRHYHEWRNYTQEDVAPDRLRVWTYYWLSRVFGFTFGVKLMERGEEDAQDSYEQLREVIPEAKAIYNRCTCRSSPPSSLHMWPLLSWSSAGSTV